MDTDFEAILAAQRRRFLEGVTRDAAWRHRQLTLMRQLLTENQQELQAALYTDFRKPTFEQLFEVTVPLGVVQYYLDHLDSLMAEEEVPVPPELAAAATVASCCASPTGRLW